MTEHINKPVLVVPMGDPNGIGPEIVVKALADLHTHKWCLPLIIGDLFCLEKVLPFVEKKLWINCIKSADQLIDDPDVINLINLDHPGIEQLIPGQIQALAGQCAADYITESVKLTLSGQADAIVTTPINKEALRAAEVPFIGHTEMLAALSEVKDPLTLFETQGLRVFFLSRHVSLRQACDLVTHDRVASMIRRCLKAIRQLGLNEGTLAVAGLNPHSGEHGLFGDEEMTAVAPAVAQCQSEGLPVVGPVSADSVFHQAHQGRYAAVLSLYHDQGHIATKTLDFERTIALTLGLPFLRTSVDHGTALDIAGQGVASAVSMQEALRLGARYCIPYSQSLQD